MGDNPSAFHDNVYRPLLTRYIRIYSGLWYVRTVQCQLQCSLTSPSPKQDLNETLSSSILQPSVRNN